MLISKSNMATYDYYYYYFCPSGMLSTRNVVDFTDFGQRWSCETALSLKVLISKSSMRVQMTCYKQSTAFRITK